MNARVVSGPASSAAGAESLRRRVSWCFAGLFAIGAVFLRPPGFDRGWREVSEHVGGLLLIVAALGRIWAYAHIGGRKDRELCRAGPYSMSRNPLYFFSFLGVCGAGFALQNLLLLAAGGAAFLLYYGWVIRAEERRLDELFGEPFRAYCREVPRFWPRARGFAAGEPVTLSPRLLLRHLSEVFWFLAAILLIEFLEWAKLQAMWRTVALG